MSEKKYELILDPYGIATLQEDGKRIWSSDDDDDFEAEFGDMVEEEKIEDVAQWLMDKNILPIDEVDIEIQDGEDFDDEAEIEVGE